MHCLAHSASVLCAAIDRETGRAKGFAHIQFDSLEGAAKALGMSGQDIGGREIFIDTAQERTGGGGGGSFGGAAGGGGFERPPRSGSYSFSCIYLFMDCCLRQGEIPPIARYRADCILLSCSA